MVSSTATDRSRRMANCWAMMWACEVGSGFSTPWSPEITLIAALGCCSQRTRKVADPCVSVRHRCSRLARSVLQGIRQCCKLLLLVARMDGQAIGAVTGPCMLGNLKFDLATLTMLYWSRAPVPVESELSAVIPATSACSKKVVLLFGAFSVGVLNVGGTLGK